MDVMQPDTLPPLRHFEIAKIKDAAKELAQQDSEGFVAKGRKDLEPVPLDSPADWSIKPYKDRNWMFQFHAWRSLDSMLHILVNEPGRAREMAERIVAEVAAWHDHARSFMRSRWVWYDMSTGIRAQKIAFLLWAFRYYGYRDLLEQDFWPALIESHLAKLTDPKELNPGNHGLFQLNGLMALLWIYPDAGERDKRIDYTAHQLEALLHDQLGDLGVHREHSPHYHFFVIKVIEQVLDAPWWESADMSAIFDLVQRAHVAKYWMLDPNGYCVPMGDSGNPRIKLKSPETLLDWPHRENGKTVGALVDAYGVVRSRPNAKRGDRSLLFMQGGFFAKTHKHADCLSFVWQERGEDILVDPGKYGYNAGKARNYFKSTRAHNTVEVDGKTFSIESRYAHGNAMETVEPYGQGWLIRADQHRPERKIRHRRTVLYLPKRLLVVLDQLRSEGSAGRKYSSWWHLNPDHELTMLNDDQRLITGLRGERVCTVSFHAEGVEGEPTFTQARGQESPMLGWVSPAYLQTIPTTTFGYSVKGQEHDVLLATVFELRPKVPAKASRVENRKGKTRLVSGNAKRFSGDDSKVLDLSSILEGF
ncbi:hypothetical protein J2T60_001880 [Natronospira proteinivora]|uniref:Heparinase II/III-like protein n=1 Tax=Natronospira proteinivora TaxID=1807133 RepID=A0ABT1G982_9GAMM|nr:heparinase II/III-family protein [Natronospira proteinivora]MCP1727880.1 hypothetical protein [Natronospira proteinivora]